MHLTCPPTSVGEARRANRGVSLISMMFGAMPAIGGVLQRLLWVVGLAWLAYLVTGKTQANFDRIAR
jgi:hypothetical protein